MLGFNALGRLALGQAAAQVGVETKLSAARGTFALAGKSISFRASEPASRGVFALSGIAASFSGNLTCANGAFALAGKAAATTTTMSSASATYALSGKTASFKGSLAAQSGTFALSGGALALRTSMSVAGGTFAFSGQGIKFNVTLHVGSTDRQMFGFAALGAVALGQGNEAPASSAYLITGCEVAFRVAMPAQRGVFAWSGIDLDFDTTFQCQPGTFLLASPGAGYYEVFRGAGGGSRKRPYQPRLIEERKRAPTFKEVLERPPPPLPRAPEHVVRAKRPGKPFAPIAPVFDKVDVLDLENRMDENDAFEILSAMPDPAVIAAERHAMELQDMRDIAALLRNF